ncbi:MAG: nucleoside monophosphate kinase [Patescibacteria group bacterium]|jgi:adenylate kinase
MVKDLIILIGPPASGKGTQGKIISDHIKYEYFAMSQAIDEFIEANPSRKDEIRSFINSGQLVPDSTIEEIIAYKFSNSESGVVTDGFPRTIEQAKFLDKNFNDITKRVFYLNLKDDSVISRIEGRRVCSSCNNIFFPPESLTLANCPQCNGKIIQRLDDNIETVKIRLQKYHEETEPLIEYYKEQDKLIKIDAEPSIEQITENILDYLENAK